MSYKLKVIIGFIISFSILYLQSKSQTTKQDSSVQISRHYYLEFLSNPTENSQATMLTCNWQYLHEPWGKGFRTGGMQLSVGFNMARFFSNKFILGICADLKGIKGFTQQHFPKEFQNDFNNSFKTSYSDQVDSAKAYTVQKAISTNGFRGNYSGSIGVIFSLFPQKYGGFLLAIKKGYRSYPVFGTYGNKFIQNGEADNVIFDLKNNYSCELIIKPYTFFRKGNINFNDVNKINFWQFITIGFYYEQLDLRTATFDKMRFANMVNSDFINKYGLSKQYGIKLGFALY